MGRQNSMLGRQSHGNTVDSVFENLILKHGRDVDALACALVKVFPGAAFPKSRIKAGLQSANHDGKLSRGHNVEKWSELHSANIFAAWKHQSRNQWKREAYAKGPSPPSRKKPCGSVDDVFDDEESSANGEDAENCAEGEEEKAESAESDEENEDQSEESESADDDEESESPDDEERESADDDPLNAGARFDDTLNNIAPYCGESHREKLMKKKPAAVKKPAGEPIAVKKKLKQKPAGEPVVTCQ